VRYLGDEAGAEERRLAHMLGGAHFRHHTGNGWYMEEPEAELRLRLVERIRQPSLESYAKAEEFIEGWKALSSDPRCLGCPHDCLWRTCIANYPEEAALLGETVNPRDHCPYTPIRCFASCMISDQEKPGKEELQVQRLFD
jgi:hypothetical protein